MKISQLDTLPILRPGSFLKEINDILVIILLYFVSPITPLCIGFSSLTAPVFSNILEELYKM